MKLACDFRNGPASISHWVVDFLLTRQAAIAPKHYPLRCHAGMHGLLKRHGLIKAQRFNAAAFQLGLDLLEVAQCVLRNARDHRGFRRVRYLARVLLHALPRRATPLG